MAEIEGSSLQGAPDQSDSSSGMNDFKRLSEFEGNTGLRITTVSFNESNYLSWSKAIQIGLSGRGRIGFVDGSISAPEPTDSTFKEWSMNDHLVMSWLLNSIGDKLHDLFTFAASSKELWDSLKELYSQQENLYRVFELKKSIADLHKGDKPFVKYLNKLKVMWDELTMLRPTTLDPATVKKRDDEDRIFKVLMGLGPEFESLQEQILTAAELPPLNLVCARIQKEETRRKLTSSYQKSEFSADSGAFVASHDVSGMAAKRFMNSRGGSSSRGRGGRSGRTNITCEHCGRNGHPKDKCWVLHPHLKQQFKEKNSADPSNALNTVPTEKSASVSIEELAQKVLLHLKSNNEAHAAEVKT